MTVAIVGILIFQIYWISSTYDVERHSFEQDINDALETVLNKDITDKTLESLFGVTSIQKNSYIQSRNESNPDAVYYKNSPDKSQSDTLYMKQGDYGIEWKYESYSHEEHWVLEENILVDSTFVAEPSRQEGFFEIKPDPNSDQVISFRSDEAYKVFGNVVVSISRHQPDLKDLAEKYRKELESRNIELPFSMAYVDGSMILQMTGEDPDVFEDSQAVQILPGRLNEGARIMAFFPKTSSYVLKRMWLTLLGSFLLVSLIAGSFLLMLQTIIRQKKISEVKNDFINNMTHEFKTPIATVSAAMEALVSFDGLSDRDKSLRYIDISRGEMNRLSGLVEKVLSISAFEQKDLILSKETFDVCKLLHEASQQYILKGAGEVTINYDPKGPAFINADKMHFENVLNNLLDNAVKYSTEEVIINVDCRREGEFVLVVVSDVGIGISKEQQKHIFEKFYRVPTGDLHSVKGFGLGLSYVKHIVELHGGSIGVQSHLGQGSEFTIAIPDIHE
mgnify:FL=1|jgi:two-component system, OmpR family, phosphate regulon sensor histidine kinase PhoR